MSKAKVEGKQSKSGMKLRLVAVDTPAPGSRQKGVRNRENDFSRRLRELWEISGLRQNAFADALTLELASYGMVVSQVNLSNWVTGTLPRETEPVVVKGKPVRRADLVLRAAEAIARRERQHGPRTVPGAQVAAFLAKLEDQGIPPRNIQIAGDVPASVYLPWRSGEVAVSQSRWNVFVHKINVYRAFLREAQDVFKAENEVRNVKSEARRRGMTVLQFLLQREIDAQSGAKVAGNVFQELDGYRRDAAVLGVTLRELVLARGVLSEPVLKKLQHRG